MDFDDIMDGFMYLVTFEWLPDLWEFITSGFEDMGEFSIYGLIFAILCGGLVFFLRKQMLNPFLDGMVGGEKIFWMMITYGGVIAAGYFMGKAFENSG